MLLELSDVGLGEQMRRCGVLVVVAAHHEGKDDHEPEDEDGQEGDGCNDARHGGVCLLFKLGLGLLRNN